jgi:hypothetical protein
MDLTIIDMTIIDMTIIDMTIIDMTITDMTIRDITGLAWPRRTQQWQNDKDRHNNGRTAVTE